MAAPEPIPPELFLEAYPPEIRVIAERLRDVVRQAVPEAVERVRTGWRLIGYDVPVGRRTRYFAFVAPEPEHVHLGFDALHARGCRSGRRARRNRLTLPGRSHRS